MVWIWEHLLMLARFFVNAWTRVSWLLEFTNSCSGCRKLFVDTSSTLMIFLTYAQAPPEKSVRWYRESGSAWRSRDPPNLTQGPAYHWSHMSYVYDTDTHAEIKMILSGKIWHASARIWHASARFWHRSWCGADSTGFSSAPDFVAVLSAVLAVTPNNPIWISRIYCRLQS